MSSTGLCPCPDGQRAGQGSVSQDSWIVAVTYVCVSRVYVYVYDVLRKVVSVTFALAPAAVSDTRTLSRTRTRASRTYVSGQLLASCRTNADCLAPRDSIT